MEDGRITDSAITASSCAALPGYRASRSRLNTLSVGSAGYGAWAAVKNDAKQWLQIDLGDLTRVSRVATQGRQDSNQWVKRYYLRYSIDGVHWAIYKDNSHKKVFSGNTDRNSPVGHNLVPSIEARFIQFLPITVKGHTSLRVELYGCKRVHSCAIPVGIEDRRIPNSAMSASSVYSGSFLAHEARLNKQRTSWIPKTSNAAQWLRINLGKKTSVTKISTQGRYNVAQYVKSFYVRHSLDGSHWVTYKQNSYNKLFSGNTDANSIVHHVLSPRIEARFIEFNPRSWLSHIAMRVEVYGCTSMPNCHLPLGLEDGRVPNAAMTASSMNSAYTSYRGRLNGPKSWYSGGKNAAQYLQVDFVRVFKVTSVATQGRFDADQYVTGYSVSSSIDGSHWVFIRENGHIKIFSGNNDRHTIIRNKFRLPIYARFVRVHPKTWVGWVTMRMELYGCAAEGSCFVPLGLEDGRIPDQYFTASTIHSNKYKAAYGRVNNIASGGNGGTWISKLRNTNQWLQVNLGRPTTVTKIATQGRSDAKQFIQSYRVSYSFDGSHWTTYRVSDGHVKIFGGNADQHTLQFNHFSPAINAKFIRVHPLIWTGFISMRLELYGCYLVNNCLMPMGVEDGRIVNAAITASSIHAPKYAAHFARLNLVRTGSRYGAWCTKTNNPNEWIQIAFSEPSVITKVATQGRQDGANWIKSFKLEYSFNGIHWAVYKHASVPVVFPGNFDQHTIQEHHISPVIYAKFLRLRPLTWQSHICMRMEVYGCSVNGIGDLAVTAY